MTVYSGIKQLLVKMMAFSHFDRKIPDVVAMG